jgi:dCMP deaminase
MACENCDPSSDRPGRIIKTTKDLRHCAMCGRDIDPTIVYVKAADNSWDLYFHSICTAVASKSPCLSRKIGAILVRDKSILSTGYNGPPRGIPHCGHDRLMNDDILSYALNKSYHSVDQLRTICPRRLLDFKSGEGMQWCPAQHAEENAVSNAARTGVSVIGSTLYMNSIIPCQKCFGTLINAGIVEIVVDKDEEYDNYTIFLIKNSNIKIRRFNK